MDEKVVEELQVGAYDIKGLQCNAVQRELTSRDDSFDTYSIALCKWTEVLTSSQFST